MTPEKRSPTEGVGLKERLSGGSGDLNIAPGQANVKPRQLSRSPHYQRYKFKRGYNPARADTVQDILQIVKTDWCPGVFNGDQVSYRSWDHCDWLYFDVDNVPGKPQQSIAEFMSTFSDLEFFLITSRNHQKTKKERDKNDELTGIEYPPADRYHVLFPQTSPITRGDDLDKMLSAVIKKYPFFDGDAKGRNRFFFGFNEAEVIYHPGKPLTVDLVEAEGQTSSTGGLDPALAALQEVEDGSRLSEIPIDREMLFAALEIASERGVFGVQGQKGGRDEWVKLGATLYVAGYDYEDWMRFSHPGEDTPANLARWHGFASTEKLSVGSLFYFIREHVDPLFMTPGWRESPGCKEIQARMAKIEPKKPRAGFQLVRIGSLDIKEPRWTVDGILEENTAGLLFAEPGHGKSFIALDLCACVATGTPFHGKITSRGVTVYIAGEGLSGVARRLRAWGIKHLINLNDAPLFVSRGPTDLNDQNALDELREALESIASEVGKPSLIVVDTLARSMSGNENDTKEMSAVVRAIDEIRVKYGATTLLVHHPGLADKTRSRGSSVLRGALDVELKAVKDPESGIITLSCTKFKDFEPFAPMFFTLGTVELGLTGSDGKQLTSAVLVETQAPELTAPKLSGTNKRYLAIVEKNPEGVRAKAVAEEIGCEYNAARVALNRLVTEGLIKKEEKGIYKPFPF